MLLLYSHIRRASGYTLNMLFFTSFDSCFVLFTVKGASGKDEISRLKRRFLKDTTDRSEFFAKQMAKRNILRKVNKNKHFLINKLLYH